MDGKTLYNEVAELLNEDPDTSVFIKRWLTFRFINQAAAEFVNRTRSVTTDQSITTVADQAEYWLNPDYIELSLRDARGEFFLKYDDGSNEYFITERDESDIVRNPVTTSGLPYRFYVEDYPITTERLTGTASEAGDATGGESTLTDDTPATFDTDPDAVYPGDTVHNTTDSSSGMVLSVTSDTAIVTALFEGTDDEWDTDDAYIIVRQARKRVVVDPAPADSGDTITIPSYIQRPPPVASDYGRFNLPLEYTSAIAKYAAYLYKYRDRAKNEGDSWYSYWDQQVRQYGVKVNRGFGRRGFRVNMKVRHR